jgi:hypothetical protein
MVKTVTKLQRGYAAPRSQGDTRTRAHSKSFRETEEAFPHEFRTECFWTAMRLRITFSPQKALEVAKEKICGRKFIVTFQLFSFLTDRPKGALALRISSAY